MDGEYIGLFIFRLYFLFWKGIWPFFPDEIPNESGRAFDSKEGRIDAKVIRGGGSPGFVGIEIVVTGEAFVFLFDQLGSFMSREVFVLGNPGNPEFFGRMNKDIETAGMLTQNVIGATTDDNAGFFTGYVVDDVGLEVKYVFVAQRTGSEIRSASHQKTER